MKNTEYKIPKVIHYVWFGNNKKSKSIKKCIKSWKKYCPDYKIIEWNEKNYNVKKNRYMYEAYKAKKWAFASDFARYDILNRCGGVYLDTDVELIANIDELLKDEMFMCFVDDKRVNSGLGYGSVANNQVLQEMLNYYKGRSFYKKNGKMDLRICNHNETAVLVKHGLVRNGREQFIDGVHVYPREYFNPINEAPTKKTVAINHFHGSWASFAHRTRNRKNIFFNKKCSTKVAMQWIRYTDLIWDIFDKIESYISCRFE